MALHFFIPLQANFSFFLNEQIPPLLLFNWVIE